MERDSFLKRDKEPTSWWPDDWTPDHHWTCFHINKEGVEDDGSSVTCVLTLTFSFDVMWESNHSCFWDSWMFILKHKTTKMFSFQMDRWRKRTFKIRNSYYSLTGAGDSREEQTDFITSSHLLLSHLLNLGLFLLITVLLIDFKITPRCSEVEKMYWWLL